MAKYDSAFPSHGTMGEVAATGLTKREWLSSMIFQQLLHGATLPPGFDASEQLAFAAKRSIESADAFWDEMEQTQ